MRPEVNILWYRILHDWTDLNRPEYLWKKIKGYGIQRRDGYYAARILGTEMLLTKYHLSNVINELELWETVYLPTEVKGKTVLSVGEGCGETALFYLKHGARKVIAIEKEREPYELLCRNVSKNNLNVETINEAFALAHLDLSYDFMKMDIEGDERILLELESRDLRPCIVEAHRFTDKSLPEKIQERFNLRKLFTNTKNAILLTNITNGLHIPPSERMPPFSDL